VAAGLVRREVAAEVVSPPYDLYTAPERARHARQHPRSFFNGTPTEGDDPEIDQEGRRQQASAYLSRELAAGTWRFEGEGLYVLRLESRGHVQTGVVGDVPASHFPGLIRPHEHTRPARVDDLAHYLEAVGYGSSPVGLTYRRRPEIDAIVALVTEHEPDLDVTLPDGDRQTVWRIDNIEVIDGLEAAFADVSSAYIIDGHHRVAATVQRGADPSTAAGRFLGAVFPDDDLVIFPIHRWLAESWTPQSGSPGRRAEPRPGIAVAVTGEGDWEIDLGVSDDDATALTRLVLGPQLGVVDERTDPRIVFVPGYPGPETLRHRVATAGGVGFLLYPASVEAVMRVSDRGGVMPPKSTFFAPKPRSGVFLVKR
jgi:uncharacterized protein (DUF1015 family)